MRIKCKTVRENLYLIPVAWRTAQERHFGGFYGDPLCTDGIGFFYRKSEGEPDHEPEWFRRFLMFRQYGHVVVEAATFHEAIQKFHDDYPGARVGGGDDNDPEKRAVWITTTGGYGDPVLKLPRCSMTCWNCDDDWKPYQLVCGGTGCGSAGTFYCPTCEQGNLEPDHCGHPHCGMSDGDFYCEGCPATQELWKGIRVKDQPPEEITTFEGRIFRCVSSLVVVEDYQ